MGDSLWEYINGGAELYHTYGFAAVLTADYKSADAELILDFYEFETDDGAYGLYTALRPDEPEIVSLGVEGFVTGSSLDFVKGNVLVRLVGFDTSEATRDAIRGLAGHMSSTLPGATGHPETFGLFPSGEVLAYSDKIVGEAFLGQSFLNMVYTRDYELGADTVTAFLLNDDNGTAIARWFESISENERSPAALAADLPFDENYYLLVDNSYYGNILAGLKNGKLVGVVNFSDRHHQFVSEWLASLPAPTGQSGY